MKQPNPALFFFIFTLFAVPAFAIPPKPEFPLPEKAKFEKWTLECKPGGLETGVRVSTYGQTRQRPVELLFQYAFAYGSLATLQPGQCKVVEGDQWTFPTRKPSPNSATRICFRRTERGMSSDWINRPVIPAPPAGEGIVRNHLQVVPGQTFFGSGDFPSEAVWSPAILYAIWAGKDFTVRVSEYGDDSCPFVINATVKE